MCSSSMRVVCTCVVSQFTFVSRLCSSIGVCACVVSQLGLEIALIDGSSVYLC